MKRRPETDPGFEQYTDEIIMYKCQISKNSKDGITASQFKATLINCQVSENDWAVVRLSNNDEIKNITIYIENKQDETKYVGRQLFVATSGRYKQPFLIEH